MGSSLSQTPDATIQDQAITKIFTTAVVTLTLGGGLAMAMGYWLGRLSVRIWSCQRFPPPGMAVVRDTRLVTGARARAMGGVGLTLSILIAGCGLGIVLISSRLVDMMLDQLTGP